MKRFTLAVLAAALCAATVGALATSARAANVVIFGDSLCDGGNIFAATSGLIPGAPYWNGHFSNGPTWAENLSVQLGVTPGPSQLGGNDFAWGAAEVIAGPTGMSAQGTPNIPTQIVGYLGATIPAADTLFVLDGGADDFGAHPATADGITTATAQVANVQGLIAAGARRVLVLNLPNLAQTPDYAGDAAAQTFSSAYDTALASGLQTLADGLPGGLLISSNADKAAHPGWSSNPGATIFLLDANTVFAAILADPAGYGFTNTTDPAYVRSPYFLASDPNTYISWDGVHPTARAHAILGDAAYALVVPEPTSLGLLAVGFTVLLGRRLRAGQGPG